MSEEELYELAFKDTTELLTEDRNVLLDIIEVLQQDRRRWLMQYAKTHNEGVDIQQERNNYKELYEKENKNWNKLKELLKTELRDVYDKEHPLALDSSYIKYTTERKMNLMWVYEKMQEIERL